MSSGLHVKYPLFLSDLMKFEFFSGRFSKNAQISNLMKIHQVGSELFHVDGRTDMTKLSVAFRNFAGRAKQP
jgi:hypothetical protein